MEQESVKGKYAKAWEKLAPVFRGIGEWCKRLIFLIPPLVTLIFMLALFKANGLYPYGSKTISWGDMDQQTVPLLMQFKDVLAGKEGFSFSLKNASGMNFFGVFFFFLASPFTFLVVFVEKANMLSFCNVLIMLKMCACALTASIYLRRKNENAPLLNVAFSLLYAYSGYNMMYYQNLMWIDVAYLFPLLLWGLERLQSGKKGLYTVALSATMIANYYIGYMIVVFLLLYAFAWGILSKDKRFALDFVLSCALAAMITAVVWLPSFWQYLSSGRTTPIIESLKNSAILSPYQTAWPTVFGVLFLFPFALKQKETKEGRLRWIMLIATLVPMVLEPINKAWQTGSYMCFPTRYGFIPIFLCLTLAFDDMGKRGKIESGFWQNFKVNWKNEAPRYALSLLLVVLSIFYYAFAKGYTVANAEVMDQYSHSLWGNSKSFEALFTLYALALAIGVTTFVLWRFRIMKPILLWVLVVFMTLSETYVAPMTYMLTPAREVESFRQIVELEGKIEDDGFYRVKTDKEYSGRDFDATTMGGIGYNALGHFTSLTKKNYMDVAKRFGYTSYWMEVGNSGGTMISDALLSVKYQISSKTTETDIYSGSYFHISQTAGYLPLGVIAKRDIVALEKERTAGTRGDMQKTLYEDFFGSDGVQTYELESAQAHNLTVEKEGGKYRLKPTNSDAYLSFTVAVGAPSILYFSAFDEYSNALSQGINEKFSVRTSGYSLSNYPTKKNNGILTLGERSGNTTVKIGVKSETLVREMSVIAVEKEKTGDYIAQTPTLGLTAKNGKVVGRYEANGGECVFLSIAYDEGLQLKINGKRATLHEVYGGFTAFYLEEGVNEIEITLCPQGFALGLIVSILGLGIGLLWIFLFKRKQRKLPQGILESVAYYGVATVGVLVVAVVYIAPLILCAL